MNGSTIVLLTALANAGLVGLLLGLPCLLRLLVSEERLRTLRRYATFLVVPMMLASGALIDKWGVQTVLLAAAVAVAFALAWLNQDASVTATVGSAALLAAGGAGAATGSLIVLPQAFFPGNAARSINLGCVVVAFAVLAVPLFAQFFKARLGSQKTLFMLAMLCLIPAALTALVPADELKPIHLESAWTPGWGDPRLILLLVAVALCAPLEAALAPWVRRYATEQGFMPGSAWLLQGGFWLAFLGSRIAAALFLPSGGEAWLVLGLVMLAAITLGNLSAAYAPHSTTLGVWLTGACCGPMLPTLLGLALQSYGGDAGPVAGLATAVGTLATLVLLPWMDASRPARSTRAAMRWATALAVVLLGPTLVLALLG